MLLLTSMTSLLAAPAFQFAYQWEKAVVLRFGRLLGLRKPGVFFLAPVIHKVARFIDQRIRVTDFSAETMLTADTVPSLRRRKPTTDEARQIVGLRPETVVEWH